MKRSDRRGRIRRALYGIGLAVCTLFVTITAAAADKRVALVLGNSAYQNAPPLNNPATDAQAMAEKLAELNFEVVSGFDLTKAETQQIVSQFAKQVRGADIALFFYAGHGMQVSGSNYLLPVDAKLEDETSLDFEAVQVDFILKQMARETKVRLAFIDACRDNPLADVLAKSGGLEQAPDGLAEIEIESGGEGTLVAFATGLNQVAFDGSGEHSPFSGALLTHLGEANVSITETMNRVTSDVLKTTAGRQRPWINVSMTTDVVLREVDLGAPLIVGESEPAADAPASVGSSRVDLQACKLEYSIVSPK